MKKMKKVLALVMAMAMVLGMGLTTFAADGTQTITVNGLATTGVNSATYVKILEPDVTEEGGYKFAEGVSIAGYATAKDFLKDPVADQKAALKDTSTHLPTATSATLRNNVFSENVTAGYYVVNITNTAGDSDPTIVYDNPMIVSVEYDKATLTASGEYEYNAVKGDSNAVTAKYTTIPVTKTGKDKENNDETVGITGTATYEIVTFIPSEVSSFILTDVLENATYLTDTVKVQIEITGNVENEPGVVTFPVTDPDQNDMVIDLTRYLQDSDGVSNAGKKVTITYDVTITGTEVNNTVTPNDGKHTYTPAIKELYTGGAQLIKYIEDGETPMANAVFVLYKEVVDQGETVKYYAKVDANNVLTGWTTDKNNPNIKLTTGSNGIVYVDGLDIGEYFFGEVEAPSGYSIISEPEKVEVTELNTNKSNPYIRASATMTDTKLSALPSTGGIGTTIFTVGGCIIMIAAAALFFMNRRKSEE